jgi:hypothetical protein
MHSATVEKILDTRRNPTERLSREGEYCAAWSRRLIREFFSIKISGKSVPYRVVAFTNRTFIARNDVRAGMDVA